MFYSIGILAFLLSVSFVNQGVEPLDCPFGKGLWLQMAYLLSYQSASPM